MSGHPLSNQCLRKMACGTEAAATRIDTLACAKPLPAGFIDDRRSVYWDNKCPKDWNKSELGTKFAISERLTQLTLPKPTHREWQGDRPTPVWLVSCPALKAQPSERISSLAEAKVHHKDFHPPKSFYTTVSDAAKKATPSERVQCLSKPKTYTELPIKPDSCWDYSEWKSDVSKTALKCQPSERVVQLAEPKLLYSAYKGCREVIWPVSEGAKKGKASERVEVLAKPKSNNQYKDHYNSEWYRVTRAARNAQATPRIEALAEPIPRKVKQKKGAAKI